MKDARWRGAWAAAVMGPVFAAVLLGVSASGQRAWAEEVRLETSNALLVDEQASRTLVSPDLRRAAKAGVFSPDSKHLARLDRDSLGYPVSRKVVIDEKDPPAHEGIIYLNELAFSPDSRRTAFVVVDPGENGNEHRVVIDEVEGKPYDWVGLPYFSADSKDVVYLARRRDKFILVVNKAETKVFPNARAYEAGTCLAISPDLKRVAWSTNEVVGGDRAALVTVYADGVPGMSFPDVRGLKFSPDSKRVVFIGVARTELGGERHTVVCDGKKGPDCRVGGDIVFSPDSSRFGYFAHVGNDACLIVDGVVMKGVAADRPPVFSPDSKRFAYVAWDSKVRKLNVSVVLDGRAGKKYEDVVGPVFSPDSRHVAYVAKCADGRLRLVLDGAEKAEVPFVKSLVFTPDSQHVVCVAIKPGGAQVVVVDGVEGETYDWVYDEVCYDAPDSWDPVLAAYKQHFVYIPDEWGLRANDYRLDPGIVFVGNDTLRILATRDRKLYCVEIKISSK